MAARTTARALGLAPSLSLPARARSGLSPIYLTHTHTPHRQARPTPTSLAADRAVGRQPRGQRAKKRLGATLSRCKAVGRNGSAVLHGECVATTLPHACTAHNRINSSTQPVPLWQRHQQHHHQCHCGNATGVLGRGSSAPSRRMSYQARFYPDLSVRDSNRVKGYSLTATQTCRCAILPLIHAACMLYGLNI